MAARFFKCGICGNLVGLVQEGGGVLTCCNEAMKELVPNTSDGAGEKHVPVITIDGNNVKVEIGAVAHPMLPEHRIDWIYLLTKQGAQRKWLAAGDEPKTEFVLEDGDAVVAAYEYCNLHGLWKAEV